MRIFAIATSLQEIAVLGSRTSKSILNPVFSFLRLSSDSVILSTSVSQSTTHHLLQTCKRLRALSQATCCSISHISAKSYNNEKLSDITICFGEEKVYAHKVILSSVSGVSSAAFES